jgi:hypothetical protein
VENKEKSREACLNETVTGESEWLLFILIYFLMGLRFELRALYYKSEWLLIFFHVSLGL